MVDVLVSRHLVSSSAVKQGRAHIAVANSCLVNRLMPLSHDTGIDGWMWMKGPLG